MASLILGVVGGILLPGFGAVLGGLAGAAIDAFLISPMLFGGQDSQQIGPRLDDLKIQTAAEGSPVQYCLGNRCRVSGNVIWISDLIEVVNTSSQEVGGKGGGGSTVTTTQYSYYISMAVAVCETPTGPIDGVWKMFLNGKKFYQDQSDEILTMTGTEYSVAPNGARMKYFIWTMANGDFTEYFTGAPLTISGLPDPENNGTFTVIEVGSLWSDGIFYTYIDVANPDGVIDAHPISTSVTFTQVIPKFSGATRVTVYDGSQTTPDTLLEAAEGDAPAYTGMALVVFEKLALANYGNSIPQAVFIVASDDIHDTTPLYIDEAIERILLRAGMDPADYDVSGIADSGVEVRGYVIMGPKTITQQLEPLLLAYDVLCRETGGVLEFFFKGKEDVVTVAEEDIGANQAGGEKTAQIEFSKVRSLTLPQEVTVKYFDPSNAVQAGSVTERRINAPHDQVDVVDLQLTLSEDEARKIARLRLWRTWQGVIKAKTRLPSRYLHLQEGDILEVPFEGETYRIFVEKATRGDNFIIEVEGTVEQNTTYEDFDGDGNGGDDEVDPPVYFPPMIAAARMDCPALSNDHVDSIGYYAGGCAASYNAQFLSYLVEQSSNNADYTIAGGSTTEAVVFRVVEDFSGAVQDPHQYDRVNTLTVQLLHGAVESVDDEAFHNGSNRVLLFSSGEEGEFEILAFKTATLVDAASRTYQLSFFRRGLRNTQDAIGNCVEGAMGIVLNTGIQFLPLQNNQIGQDLYYKFPSSMQDLDDAEALQRTLVNRTRLNFPPCHIKAARNGSNDVNLTWTRRTRGVWSPFLGSVPPLLEEAAVYEFDLMTFGGGSVHETYQVIGDDEMVIPDADIVAAGYSSGASIVLRAYQLSFALGRGDYAEVTV